MEFKDVLKDLRIKNNLSQQQLADKIFVSRSAVAKWENGLGLPNEDSVEQLMKFFDVDRDSLFPVIKQEDIIIKNKKIHKFKFGNLIAIVAVLIIALVVTIVMIKTNNKTQVKDLIVEVNSIDIYSYSYEDKCEEDGVYYIIYDSQAIICGYNETLGNDIVIKESYEGYPTTKIGHNAFENCYNLKSVVLPDTICTISNSAFSECNNLTSVTVAKNKANRRRLQPSKLNWMIVAEVENSIDKYAFKNCINLVEISYPDNIREISTDAFEGCTSLKSIYISKNINYLGLPAFSNCPSLESIVVDSENPIFDSRDNCNGIIRTETNELVLGCKNTIIPNTVTSIGYKAFTYCNELKTYVIPEGITKVDDQAFEYCINLTSVTISKTVTSINGSAFSGCDNLVSIKVDEDNPVYDSRDNCNAIIVTEKNSLRVGCKATVIPSSVVSIEGSAFINNRTISNITIPNSVSYIGKYAFSGCVSLTSITIPASATNLSNDTFWNCTGLSKVVFEDGIRTINGKAFYGCCNVTEVIIPGSVETINSETFSCFSGINTIRYYGKKSKWKSITEKGWDDNLDSYVVVCENGKISKN